MSNKLKKAIKTIFLVEIVQGLALTLKTMFTPSVTRQYPTVKRKAFAGSRGLHYMDRDDSGLKERCIGCGLCEAVCPSKAITVVTIPGPEREKLVASYELDLLRCVFCGFCVDACPVNAIKMTPDFELACYQRRDVFYTKERLMDVGDRYLHRKTGGSK
ncbi:MAG: NADH-quinone oxidoreductase subunit NuoI [Nitrospirota bacterium]|nr:NADH-quinone oxidoreductase subunit NuoI [Nitrospirota bacterium]